MKKIKFSDEENINTFIVMNGKEFNEFLILCSMNGLILNNRMLSVNNIVRSQKTEEIFKYYSCVDSNEIIVMNEDIIDGKDENENFINWSDDDCNGGILN